MKGIIRKLVTSSMSVLVASLALLSFMFVEGDHGLLVYIGLLTVGALFVGALAVKIGVRAKELAVTSVWLVPLLVIAGLLAVYGATHLISSVPKGPTEGDGLVILTVFVLLPSMFVGLFGSLFNTGLSKKKGTRS